MAEPLKNSFGPDVARRIARDIQRVWRQFDGSAFVRDALAGFDELELTQRARQIARSMGRYLPDDYAIAIELLLSTLGPEREETEGSGMAPFFYMPHACFVGEYGLGHFEASMIANYEITKRFTAEYSIRPFLIHHGDRTMARLDEWTADPNVHVRRLVSEGTRPLLPWAPRLPGFREDPRPVIRLLEKLKDDEELYVRRSVANNLNDIGKDNPGVLLAVAKRWMRGADERREWVVRHGLRTLVKAGDARALAILGFGGAEGLVVRRAEVTAEARIGEGVSVSFEVANESGQAARALVDLRVHYVKSNGSTSPKVFKLREVDLGRGESVALRKTLRLNQMTTRTHYPGSHHVDALVNGSPFPVGTFRLLPENE